jgi:hypothetical protein
MIRLFNEKPSQLAPEATPPAHDAAGIATLEARHVDLLAAAEADERSATEIESEVSGLGWQIAQIRERRDGAIHAGNGSDVDRMGAQMSALSVRIENATKGAAEVRQAANLKRKECESILREIQAVQRAPIELKRREKIAALIPVLIEVASMMADIHRDEHELRERGSQLVPAAFNELSFSGGEGILVETWFSKWLDARRAEGFNVPPSEDNNFHIPPSAAQWARTQIDSGYAAHAVRCGTRAGIVTGFDKGFLHRARNFS